MVVPQTVAQAQPSVRDPSVNEIEREGPVCTPRAPRRRPAVARNTCKRRKSRESDDSSDDEYTIGRKTKVYASHSAFYWPLLMCEVFLQRAKRDRT